MGSLALIYLLLGAEFVAVVQVIIYAGAIMVLFIFVIMLLNAGEEEQSKGSRVAKFVGIPGLFLAASSASGSCSSTVRRQKTASHRRALWPRRQGRHDAVHQVSSGF